MKKRLLSTIITAVLVASMITPVLADDYIEEEIVIDSAIIEEENILAGDLDEEIVEEVQKEQEIIEEEIIEDVIDEDIIESSYDVEGTVCSEVLVEATETVDAKVVEEDAAIADADECVAMAELVDANDQALPFEVAGDISDLSDIASCDGGIYDPVHTPRPFFYTDDSYRQIATKIAIDKYKESKLYVIWNSSVINEKEGYTIDIFNEKGDRVKTASAVWKNTHSRMQFVFNWDTRMLPAGKYKTVMTPYVCINGLMYSASGYNAYMDIIINPDVNDTYVVTMPETKGSWVKSGANWKFKNPSGAYVKNSWVCVNKKFYYLDANGIMRTGWYKVNNLYYYFNSNGAMQKGWIKINNIWYYLNPNGKMLTGWQQINGDYYYFNANGAMLRGWIKLGNKDYYLYPDGHLAQDEWIGKYHVNVNGVWDKTR